MENKSPYCRIKEETQLYLASLLSLKRELRSESQFIGFDYTESDPKYPEIILNLSWGLVGNWRVVNLFSLLGNDGQKALKCYADLLSYVQKDDHYKWNARIGHLYNHQSSSSLGCRKVEVRGFDFDEGIKNLFEVLSLHHEEKIEGSDYVFRIPVIIIHQTGSSNYYSYDAYCYVPSEKSFKHLYFKETPNYVKDFLEKYKPFALFEK